MKRPRWQQPRPDEGSSAEKANRQPRRSGIAPGTEAGHLRVQTASAVVAAGRPPEAALAAAGQRHCLSECGVPGPAGTHGHPQGEAHECAPRRREMENTKYEGNKDARQRELVHTLGAIQCASGRRRGTGVHQPGATKNSRARVKQPSADGECVPVRVNAMSKRRNDRRCHGTLGPHKVQRRNSSNKSLHPRPEPRRTAPRSWSPRALRELEIAFPEFAPPHPNQKIKNQKFQNPKI